MNYRSGYAEPRGPLREVPKHLEQLLTNARTGRYQESDHEKMMALVTLWNSIPRKLFEFPNTRGIIDSEQDLLEYVDRHLEDHLEFLGYEFPILPEVIAKSEARQVAGGDGLDSVGGLEMQSDEPEQEATGWDEEGSSRTADAKEKGPLEEKMVKRRKPNTSDEFAHLSNPQGGTEKLGGVSPEIDEESDSKFDEIEVALTFVPNDEFDELLRNHRGKRRLLTEEQEPAFILHIYTERHPCAFCVQIFCAWLMKHPKAKIRFSYIEKYPNGEKAFADIMADPNVGDLQERLQHIEIRNEVLSQVNAL
ncbi:hypothetical protein HDV00_001766 [Rhizophlyctis rosea]|nr:hypothetical protein HDV00_001766 [Rhizophlyctis rosea]